MRIETMPGEQFQFDWSDCNTFARCHRHRRQ
jgi:hypothetical protein